jgi:signal transduction histidine kinase
MCNSWTVKFFLFIQFLFVIDQYSFAHHSSTQIDAIDLHYIIDDQNKYTLNEILHFDSLHTLQHGDPSFNLGYDARVVWLTLHLSQSLMHRILVINNAHLDHLDFYLFSGNHLARKVLSGDLRDFASRDLNNNYFNLNIPPSITSIVIRVHTEGPMVAPVQLMTYQHFFTYWKNYSIFHWIIFGFIGLFIISNLALYIWLKEKIYIYYILLLASIALITGVDFGYTFQYLWPHHPEINTYNSLFYFACIFSLLFTEKILNLKKDLPLLYKVFVLLYLLMLTCFLLSFIVSYRVSIEMIYYTYISAPLISLVTAIYAYFKYKNQSSKFVLFGLLAFFSATIIYILSVGGTFQTNSFTENMVQIGSCIQIVFFNLATLSRINILKKEKEDLLAHQNKLLEEKVVNRTIELKRKNEQITNQNIEIEEKNKQLKDQHQNLEKIVEERTEELQLTNAELLHKNRRLEQFAFVTAHNIRGPIATLLGLFQIYNKKDLSDPYNSIIITKGEELTQKLDNIIKDLTMLLDLERNISSLVEWMDLNEVMNETSVLLGKEITDSKAVIETDFQKASKIHAIPAYVNNIFYNLISNSIKFKKYDTPPHIKIYTSINDKTLIITFEDNGTGIDLEKFGEKLGTPYKRFNTDVQGKGLGLFITKRQIEAMKGKMEIHSKPNHGTRILVCLPFYKEQN